MSLKLTIGIPTFKRPSQLKTLIDSISNLVFSERFHVSVLIVDNDARSNSTDAIINNLKQHGFPYCIEKITVSERGISQVRNAMLDYVFLTSKSDFLAMVDDDEEVDQYWLQELIKCAIDYKADYVGGNKIAKFSSEPKQWMIDCKLYASERPVITGYCDLLRSTDNLLVSKSGYQRLGAPKFDLSFALTGGGDTELLTRVKKLGAIFAYSQSAITYEIIPQERMTFEWAKARAFRIGIGLARVDLLHGPQSFFFILSKFLYSILGVLKCLIKSKFHFRDESKSKVYQIWMSTHTGRIKGYFGKRVYPYAS